MTKLRDMPTAVLGGLTALAFSALYLVSDVIEALQGGFAGGEVGLTLIAESGNKRLIEVDRDGKILSQGRQPMMATGTPEAALHAVTNAIDSLMSTGNGIQGIGICAPGPLDPKTGIVLNPPNLPCWRNFPLAEKVTSKYRVPVKVDNDANAAALAGKRPGGQVQRAA